MNFPLVVESWSQRELAFERDRAVQAHGDCFTDRRGDQSSDIAAVAGLRRAIETRGDDEGHDDDAWPAMDTA